MNQEPIKIDWYNAVINQKDVDRIEKRTKQDVLNLLKKNGLGRNKRNRWEDYSKTKKLIFEGHFIDCDIYDKQMSWIIDYLGV